MDVVTEELAALLAVELHGGQTLKVNAAAGTGKSTALRLYALRCAPRPILYLTFTKSEAVSKALDYASRGMCHVRVSTLHALAYEATHDVHCGSVTTDVRLTATVLASRTRPDLWNGIRLGERCQRTACWCFSTPFPACGGPTTLVGFEQLDRHRRRLFRRQRCWG